MAATKTEQKLIPDALMRAASNIDRIAAQEARKFSLTPNQLRILLLLLQEPGLSVSDIHRRVAGLDRKTCSTIIASMHKRKLITRVRSKSTPQSKLNVLTSSGRLAAARALHIHERIHKAIGQKLLGTSSFMSLTDNLETIAALDPDKGFTRNTA